MWLSLCHNLFYVCPSSLDFLRALRMFFQAYERCSRALSFYLRRFFRTEVSPITSTIIFFHMLFYTCFLAPSPPSARVALPTYCPIAKHFNTNSGGHLCLIPFKTPPSPMPRKTPEKSWRYVSVHFTYFMYILLPKRLQRSSTVVDRTQSV